MIVRDGRPEGRDAARRVAFWGADGREAGKNGLIYPKSVREYPLHKDDGIRQISSTFLRIVESRNKTAGILARNRCAAPPEIEVFLVFRRLRAFFGSGLTFNARRSASSNGIGCGSWTAFGAGKGK